MSRATIELLPAAKWNTETNSKLDGGRISR
ncbi:MAG: hypothetical protein ACJAT0_001279 [Nonlabens sp.]|jgi:hypothetical protein